MSISGILSSAFSQTRPTNVATPAHKFFSQLASELESGDSSAAQNDLSTRQQALQGKSASASPTGSSSASHAGSTRRPHNDHRWRANGFDSADASLLQDLDPAAQGLTLSNILQATAASTSTPSPSSGLPSSIAESSQAESPISGAAVSFLA